MPHDPSRTQQLLQAAAAGDAQAAQVLLNQHRQRLKRMIAARMDPRLAARLDPSDIVQETLLIAAQGLAEYAREQPLPFYPWLRRLAWQRVVDLRRRHLEAARRSVLREESPGAALSGESLHRFARRLATAAPGPHSAMERAERVTGLRKALDQLDEGPREVLLMRFLEDLSVEEVAALLEISPEAVKMRQLRALKRLRQILTEAGDSGHDR